MSRCLVIDTTVVRASGGEAASNPLSTSCRDFLKAVLSICHKVTITPDIQSEWKKHRSRFSSTWLTSMDARKKVVRIGTPDIRAIRKKLEKIPQNQGKEAMIKDLHLVAAASAGDGLIVSLDEEARGFFEATAESIGELKSLVWVNPGKTEDLGISWLKNGAPSEKKRQLAPE